MALDALIGHGAMLGLREEATYGTSAGASTHWLPVLSITPTVAVGTVPIPYLGVANAQVYHAQRDAVTLSHDASLDVSGVLSYDDKACALLLKHAFGAVATLGAGPYQHTLSPDTDGVVGLTCQVLKGTGITSPAELFTGGKVARFEMEFAARSWATWRATIICKQAEGVGAVAGTPAFTAAEEFLGHQAGTFTWSGNTDVIRRLRVIIDHSLTRRAQLSSLYTDVPLPSGHGITRWEVERSAEDFDYYTDYLSGATAIGDAQIVFTGTGSNAATLTITNAVLDSYSDPIDRAGEIVQRFGGFGLPDATDQGITFVINNANSSFT